MLSYGVSEDSYSVLTYHKSLKKKKKVEEGQAVVAQAFNLSSWEAVVGG